MCFTATVLTNAEMAFTSQSSMVMWQNYHGACRHGAMRVSQGLTLIATPLASLVSVATADSAIELDTVKIGIMDEMSDCEGPAGPTLK